MMEKSPDRIDSQPILNNPPIGITIVNDQSQPDLGLSRSVSLSSPGLSPLTSPPASQPELNSTPSSLTPVATPSMVSIVTVKEAVDSRLQSTSSTNASCPSGQETVPHDQSPFTSIIKPPRQFSPRAVNYPRIPAMNPAVKEVVALRFGSTSSPNASGQETAPPVTNWATINSSTTADFLNQSSSTSSSWFPSFIILW